MMTYKEARELRQAHDAAVRQLSRTTRYRLAEQLAERDQADGRIRLIGGPRTKDELVRELLDLDYPHAQLNEANHVLYHAPSARWEACEHCQVRPPTTTVSTCQLRPGDVVLEHGMRIRVDEVREYHPAEALAHGNPVPVWSCPGTVLNAADVIAQHVVPASFLQAFGYVDGEGFRVVREDAWTIQGNALAVWIVELPRPVYATWSSREAPLDQPEATP